MAIYKTSADSPNLVTHLGTPTLADGDEIQVEEYSQDFTAGADLSATDLVKFRIGPGSSSRFLAASGGQLVLKCNRTSTGLFVNQSSADQIEVRAASTSGVIWSILNSPQNSSGILRLDTCDNDLFYQMAGSVYQQSGADVNRLFVVGGKYFSRNGSAALGTAYILGGSCDIERDAGTVNVHAGVTNIGHSSFTPGTVNVRGGLINVKKTGNWGALNGDGGVIDLRECKSSGGSSGYLFTISSGTIYPGLTFRQVRGGLLPDISGCTLPMGSPKYEFV